MPKLKSFYSLDVFSYTGRSTVKVVKVNAVNVKFMNINVFELLDSSTQVGQSSKFKSSRLEDNKKLSKTESLRFSQESESGSTGPHLIHQTTSWQARSQGT